MSLLTMIQDAADMIGVARPSVVVSATDQTARTLLSLAQVEGRELAKRGDWEELMSEGTFNTVATTAKLKVIPVNIELANSDYYNADHLNLNGAKSYSKALRAALRQ